jgi:hypothetical protein
MQHVMDEIGMNNMEMNKGVASTQLADLTAYPSLVVEQQMKGAPSPLAPPPRRRRGSPAQALMNFDPHQAGSSSTSAASSPRTSTRSTTP